MNRLPLSILVLVVLLSVWFSQDVDARHSKTSLPCSIQISEQSIPVTYNNAPRNNPDGTYYPGDSFYYVMKITAGPSCVSFKVSSPSSSSGISIDSKNVVYGNIRKGAKQYDHKDNDPYVDSDSASKLGNYLKSSCGSNTQYSACVFGKATITHHPKTDQCFSIQHCIDNTQKIQQKAIAVKRVCVKTIDGIKCRDITLTRTGTITPPILAPNLNPVLTLETLMDSDGYDTRNLDDTYYLWDPVTVLHIPQLEWKDHRENTIHYKVQKNTQLNLEQEAYCTRNFCDMTLEHNGIQASRWAVGNGDGLDIYNATNTSHLKLHTITYDVYAYNNDVLLDSKTVSIDALVVKYEPVYKQYPYSLLSDDRRTAYENRAAVAIHYLGSVGGSLDDGDTALHENRRSKINDFYYVGIGFDPWNPVIFDDVLQWSEVADVGILEEHKGAHTDHPVISGGHDNVIPCSSESNNNNNTAMLIRAGYCRVYFEYPILDTVITPLGPKYENVTLFNTLISDNFAGKKTTYLSHYEYMFPESLFHTWLSISSLGVNGTENPVPITVEVQPLMDPQTQNITGYLHDKVYHDSDDAGFAKIISEDTYPTSYKESGIGNIDIKMHRTSVKFETYQDLDNQRVDGLGITDLASAYFENSRRARFAVPLSVGLGSLSPISVTIHADNSRMQQYDYSYMDFGTRYNMTLNIAQNNELGISRHDGTVSITPHPSFGQISALYVDGGKVDIPCNHGCVIGTPSNKMIVISAENLWGGQAHGVAAEFAVKKNIPIQNVTVYNLVALIPVILALPIIYWIYQKVKAS